MDKYIYGDKNGLRYELQGDYQLVGTAAFVLPQCQIIFIFR